MVNINKIKWRNTRANPKMMASASAILPMEGFTMTSFVHIDPPAEHLGVSRVSAAIERIRVATQNIDTAGLSVRIVIAAGAVLLAIANQLTTHEVDGGWMVAWIAVCAILFGVLALSAHKLSPFLARLSARRATARADAQFYAYAKRDPRIMQELEVAMTRQQVDGVNAPITALRA